MNRTVYGPYTALASPGHSTALRLLPVAGRREQRCSAGCPTTLTATSSAGHGSRIGISSALVCVNDISGTGRPLWGRRWKRIARLARSEGMHFTVAVYGLPVCIFIRRRFAMIPRTIHICPVLL